jgi:DNA-directed RNA polymerase subunit RPC12/RpoP
MKIFKYGIIIAAIIIFGSGVGLCIWLAANKPMSNNETVFLGVFVSLLSILASWLVSHIYAELSVRAARDDARNNLRTYALKAAEKVTNLSNELSKLAGYLQDELDDTSYGNPEADLQGKNERIYSAIHLLQSLKSVNDGSLSDWEGVIGDELNNQRELEREREEELAEMSERVAELSAAMDGYDATDQIEQLRREIRNVALHLGSRGILPNVKKPKHSREARCPSCGAGMMYKQRPKANSFKTVNCGSCKSKFYSRYHPEKKEFILESRHNTHENVACPYCEKSNEFEVDNLPGISLIAPCAACGRRIRIARDPTLGIRAFILAKELGKQPLQAPTEEVLAAVEARLPAQPWESGVHQRIAAELKLTEATARAAVSELVRRGKFFHQFEGKLFTAVQNGSSAHNHSEITSR